MERKLTSLEVIGMAIRSEEDAAKFYGHISTMTENDLVRAKYRQLAKEETGHKKVLVNLYTKMTNAKGPPPKIPGEPDTAEGGVVPDEISGSLEDLLKLAIDRERKAKDFYRDAAAKATDLSGERILRYLSDVEHGHELMLKNELEAYLRDTQWYTGEEWPEMLHVGP
jgi:erythrin-vacuolar iron transport family protein